MLKSRSVKIMLASLIVLVATVGIFGNSGFVYAADRTVIGELWSADN